VTVIEKKLVKEEEEKVLYRSVRPIQPLDRTYKVTALRIDMYIECIHIYRPLIQELAESLITTIRLTCLRLPSLNYFVHCHRGGSCHY